MQQFGILGQAVHAGWRGPSTRLDGGALLWGYTAEVLMFMSNNI